jgi:hypothetical protein
MMACPGCDHRRSRAGWTGCGRLWRVGGTRCPRAGVERTRRTSRIELEDRKLPRLSDRHLRQRPGRSSLCAALRS